MITFTALFVGLLFCIIASAFFSGSEMSYSCSNQIRLENLQEEGNKNAKRALFITNHFDDALSAILIGNNLCNIASSSISSVLIILLTGNDSLTWLSTLVITIVIIIFGETVPKILSKRNATARAMSYSFVTYYLIYILKPLIFIVVSLVNLICKPLKHEEEISDSEETVDELHSIIETAQDEGVLDEDDTEIIQAAIDFQEISAIEVMTARVDVQAMDIEDSWEDKIALIENTPYSRIPVYQDSIDNIIGVLHLNRFLRSVTENESEFDIRPLLIAPCHVYKTMKLPKVLSLLKSSKQHMAIVTDEYSGTLGVITLEDVMEQIVGEIWDESDTVEDEVIEKTSGEYEIDGNLPIGDFLELIDCEDAQEDIQSETVGGWTIEELGSYPDVGSSFKFRDFKITVLEVDELRVLKILAKKED